MSSKGAGKEVAARLLKCPAAGSRGNGINGLVLSAYAAGLPNAELNRYKNKIASIHHDPYLLSMSPDTLPATVTFESIIDYALHKKSSYTGSSFQSFKALDSKTRYEAGMVKLVEGVKIGTMYVVRGKVMHSMSVNKRCLIPWVIIEGSTILCAHCDCPAGTGEVCSHVGAVLYYLTNLQHRQLISSQAEEVAEEVAVTDREQQWGRPNKSITENLQQPIEQIDYGYEIVSFDAGFGNIPKLRIEELRDVFRTLSSDGIQCSAMQEFCSDDCCCFRCESTCFDSDYLTEGVMLDKLYDSSLENHSIEQLQFLSLQLYAQMQSAMNETLQAKISNDTVTQWKSELWKIMRVGRITASVVKNVYSTSISNPAISTVKKICYPDLTYFSTQATRHGKAMEKVALNQLRSVFLKTHKNASLRESGLIVDINHPELAASPDGILKCDCCGEIPVEVKCPFRFNNETDIIAKLTRVSQPYIRVENGQYIMVESHAYYSQVQMQIALVKSSFGYFYVWAKTEHLLIKVERNLEYWRDLQTKSNNFFKVVILPELFAKFYTKKNEKESLRMFRKNNQKQD